MNEKFIEAIDEAVVSSGYSDRAKFIRDAIVEKLEIMGIKLPKEITSAPSKIGKGGRRTSSLPIPERVSSSKRSLAADTAASLTGGKKLHAK